MRNPKRNYLFSVPFSKSSIAHNEDKDFEQILYPLDIQSPPITTADLSGAATDNLSGKYETLLHQIDDLLANSLEHSNRVLSETQFDYLIMNQLFNALNDGIWALDRNHTILRANKKFLSLIGKTAEKIIGKKCYDVFADCEACRSHKECPGSRILNGESLVKLKTQTITAEGEIFQFMLVSTPLLGLDNNVIGVVETFTDIASYE
jgi:PAS domain S-box-containing protein